MRLNSKQVSSNRSHSDANQNGASSACAVSSQFNKKFNTKSNKQLQLSIVMLSFMMAATMLTYMMMKRPYVSL